MTSFTITANADIALDSMDDSFHFDGRFSRYADFRPTPSADRQEPSMTDTPDHPDLVSRAGRVIAGATLAPGEIIRTDSFDVDATLADWAEKYRSTDDPDVREQIYGLYRRTSSVADLEPGLYRHFRNNPTSVANWFPLLHDAVALYDRYHAPFFRLPDTRILRLGPELAQFLRIEYAETSPESRTLFNQIVAAALRLDLSPGSTYFLKTGVFSSKFEFTNARCTEPDQAGEYFQAINNFAMTLGAGTTVDLCVREYIDPPANTPTIYHGMPLRCEFRSFVNLDAGDTGGPWVLGLVPYWHPSVMERALFLGSQVPGMDHIRGDYVTYKAHRDELMCQFHENRDLVIDRLTDLLPMLSRRGMRGAWSLDIMLSGTDFWIIDMAPMAESALTDLLTVTDEYAAVDPVTLAGFTEPSELVYPEPEEPFRGEAISVAGFEVEVWGRPAGTLRAGQRASDPAGTT